MKEIFVNVFAPVDSHKQHALFSLQSTAISSTLEDLRNNSPFAPFIDDLSSNKFSFYIDKQSTNMVKSVSTLLPNK